MSNVEEYLERMNKVASWELAGTIQYLHHSTMITGPWREALGNFFHEGSEEARDHAEAVAERIVSLGGVPTIEPEKVRMATTVEEMLEAALALEEDALEAWLHAYELAEHANPGTMFWMEEYIAHEQEHVDHLRKLTRQVSPTLSGEADESDESAG